MCKGGPGRPCPRIGTISAQDRQNLEVGISGWIFDSNQIQSRFEIESNPIDGSTRLSWPCPTKLIRSQCQLRLAASSASAGFSMVFLYKMDVSKVGMWTSKSYILCKYIRTQMNDIAIQWPMSEHLVTIGQSGCVVSVVLQNTRRFFVKRQEAPHRWTRWVG